MDELWQPSPLPEEPPPRPPRRRWRRRLMVMGWTARTIAAVLIVAIGLFFFLTRTDRGASEVVEQVLRRLPIRGEITATAARSDELLRGVRLYGLSIRGDDGRMLAVADSVSIQYNWRTLVSGDVVFDSLEVWQPTVMLSRYPGEREFNVERIFVSEEEAKDTARTPLKDLIFRGVLVHGGELRVLYPAGPDPSPRWLTVPSPVGDSLLRRQTFAGIDAVLPTVLVQSHDTVGQRVTIDSLSFLGGIVEDPVRVRNARGRVRFEDTRLDVDLDRLVLEGSEAQGRVFAEFPGGTNPIHFGFDLNSPGIDLADLAWLDGRIGEGHAEGGLAWDAQGAQSRLTFRALQLSAPESQVRLDGVVVIEGDHFRMEDLDVRAAPLALARIEPWLARPLPVKGSVEGTAALDGTLGNLATSGRLTLRRTGPGEGPITAEFGGTLDLEGEVGFTDVHATLDPFDFGALGAFVEGARLQGAGSVTIDAAGRASEGIAINAAIRHRPAGLPASDVFAEGTLRKEGEWILDLRGNLQPLSLTALARDYPGLPLTGRVTGSIVARGPLSDLTLVTDLATEAGRLAVTARFDAANPGAHYAVQGEVTDFALSRLATDLPQPTVISGFVDVQGRGTEPGTLTLDARARLRPSRVGGLFVDTAGLVLRVSGGQLRLDTMDAVLGGVAVEAHGTLAMVSGAAPGTIELTFESDSLGRLRPLVLGDVVIARDTLSALDRELLLAEGIDPDTLPTRADVTVSGAVRGRATLTGSIEDFTAEGEASFDRIRYGRNLVSGAEVTFQAAGLPGTAGRFAVQLDGDSVTALDRRFADARIALEYTSPQGRFDVALVRNEAESYTARGAFELRGEGGSLDLEEMALRFDSDTWALERPSSLVWNDERVRVRDFLVTGAADSLRIAADGLIPRQGAIDLRLDVAGLPLERVARLLQREDLGVTGRVALTARMTGTADQPLIVGGIDARGLDFQTYSLTRLVGQIDYADQTLRLNMGAWQDSLRVLTASGLAPVDLAFREMGQRVPTDRQLDLIVNADSLPAAFALGYLTSLSQVEGTVSGQFHVVGTIDRPSPSGTVALNKAAWAIEELGVRHQDVLGTLTLLPDGTVDVQIEGTSGGQLRTTGTVTLQPLNDPTFNLVNTGSEFLAVRRPDVEATLTGAVALTGTYSRPVVSSAEGAPLRVDEGVLYVEEFQRTVGIVDLADPAFFTVVDTAVVNPSRLLGSATNPFLRNLRVDVDLTAQGNSWLRSEEMNVEMGGELQVVYDRQSRDLVTFGALQAIRGTYAIMGRNFQVESGTVEFVGTPGINPILNIVATTRVRQGSAAAGGDNISIQATVSGTLLDPRVTLVSPDNQIAESDLVSYLVFGVPSYQLASGQAAQVQSATQSIVGNAVGAGLSIFQGTLASQLSSLVARAWGLDYFAISQREQLNVGSDLGGLFASTTFEVGWYLEQDVFVTLLLTPLASRTGTGTNPFGGGARLDWSLGSGWTLQAFYEDRYLRQPTLGFDQQILQSKKVGGLFLFTDWGYNGGGGSAP